MKRLLVLAAAAAALSTAACVTVVNPGEETEFGWTGKNAQPFDASREACRLEGASDRTGATYRTCMAGKGWTPAVR
ncbi:MAG: hypothetical protein KF910_04765 [Brevundimonas sp.]|uniref:hypothetical protein n=1 Tax=Brevundimonas sp. TaxID=1871086 RepID=UPI0025C48078|nr:hypothetical protein [Brevundimonas sp.]MBX3476895.1 hypothetical protein [Brevundimonas sp.]